MTIRWAIRTVNDDGDVMEDIENTFQNEGDAARFIRCHQKRATMDYFPVEVEDSAPQPGGHK